MESEEEPTDIPPTSPTVTLVTPGELKLKETVTPVSAVLVAVASRLASPAAPAPPVLTTDAAPPDDHSLRLIAARLVGVVDVTLSNRSASTDSEANVSKVVEMELPY